MAESLSWTQVSPCTQFFAAVLAAVGTHLLLGHLFVVSLPRIHSLHTLQAPGSRPTSQSFVSVHSTWQILRGWFCSLVCPGMYIWIAIHPLHHPFTQPCFLLFINNYRGCTWFDSPIYKWPCLCQLLINFPACSSQTKTSWSVPPHLNGESPIRTVLHKVFSY